MDLFNTIEICRAYSNLGGAIQDQLDTVLENSAEDTLADCNINALAYIHEFLVELGRRGDEDVEYEARGLAEEIVAYIEASGFTIHYGRVVAK